MRFETLNEWLTWLEQLHPNEIDLGLDRIQKVADQMGILPLSATVVTVAGTNGKGSTVSALEALLREPHGEIVSPQIGVYTSPHLNDFNERIVVNRLPVSEMDLCRAFHQVDSARLSLCKSSEQAVSLSYFEFTTLAALYAFGKQKLDYVLLEVGLGGRLDAVNIVDPDISVITTIALDHQSWLGHTREDIGREKAGILRPRGLTVVGERNPPASLKEKVALLQCDTWWANGISQNQKQAQNETEQLKQGELKGHAYHGFYEEVDNLYWIGHSAEWYRCKVGPLPEPKLMRENWSCAMQAALLLDALPPPIRLTDIMAQTQLTGRRSVVRYADREFILDVGHNIEAIMALVTALKDELIESRSIYSNNDKIAAESNTPYEDSDKTRFCMVFAVMNDKSYSEMIGILEPMAEHWFFPQLSDCPRACSPNLLKGSLISQADAVTNANTTDTVAESLNRAIQTTTRNDKIIVCGSFYTVAAAMDYFRHECAQEVPLEMNIQQLN